ncbi:hypothetical protein [Thiolinea disciformis]|uniref:hypothetical protein n=1 Tax=Thiolinea disciformis TaxID=125614 RepID=UPI00037F0DB6|nr:hypothetical protein [Thiolinea disciformis]
MLNQPTQAAATGSFSSCLGIGFILALSLGLSVSSAMAEEKGLVAKVSLQAPTTSFLNTPPDIHTPLEVKSNQPQAVNVTQPLENALKQLADIKQAVEPAKKQVKQQVETLAVKALAVEPMATAPEKSAPEVNTIAPFALSKDELKKLSKQERAKYDALLKSFNEVQAKEAKLNAQQAALQKRLAELEAANEVASQQIDAMEKLKASTTNPSPTLAKK